MRGTDRQMWIANWEKTKWKATPFSRRTTVFALFARDLSFFCSKCISRPLSFLHSFTFRAQLSLLLSNDMYSFACRLSKQRKETNECRTRLEGKLAFFAGRHRTLLGHSIFMILLEFLKTFYQRLLALCVCDRWWTAHSLNSYERPVVIYWNDVSWSFG